MIPSTLKAKNQIEFKTVSENHIENLVDRSCFRQYSQVPSQYSINCFLASIECFAIENNLVDDISLCHFEHGFSIFSDGSGTVDSVQIDNAWPFVESHEMMAGRVMQRLKNRCGLTTTLEIAIDSSSFLARLKDLNYHTICIYDIFNLETRAEYQSKHGLSVVIINGYDEKSKYFGILERKNGQSYTSLDNMKTSIDYYLKQKKGCHLFHLVKVEPTEAYNDICIQQDLERIIDHYYSPEQNQGANGIEELNRLYPDLLAHNRAFVIPGAVKFFGERFANARFLKRLIEVGHPFALSHKEHLLKLITLYDELGQLWRSFDVFHMYSVGNNDHSILRRNIPILSSIKDKERECILSLEALLKTGFVS